MCEIPGLFRGSQFTSPTVPEDAPEDLRALDVDSTDVVLTWDPVDAASVRGLLLGYKVWAGTLTHSRMYFNLLLFIISGYLNFDYFLLYLDIFRIQALYIYFSFI